MILLKKSCGVFLVMVIILSMLLLMAACQSYRDLDNIVFVTSVLVDQDDDYFETLNSIRNSSKEANKEERIVYKITCQNAGDALNQLEAHTSAPITLAHNKIILFTERFSKNGLDQVFDMFDRWQEANTRALLGIFVGEPKDFIEPNHPEDDITGLYLYELLNKEEFVTSVGVRIDIKEFMNQKYIGDKVSSIPIINVSTDEDIKGQYYLDGVGLVKEYKMVGRLDRDQTLYFNFLVDNPVSGNLSVQNPEEESKTVSLLLLHDQCDSDVELSMDDVLIVTLTLKLDTDISAVQGKVALTDDNINKIKASMIEKIEQNCLKLFQEWKDKKMDIFDIQEEFERKYPSDKRENIIENAELQMDIRLDISGTTTIKNAE